MPTIEEQKWSEFVEAGLPGGPTAKLDKRQQQVLAVIIQQWVAACIGHYLDKSAGADAMKDVQITWKGKKNFLGGVRWQEVDVWMSDDLAGLVLAVDPKHFQSADSLGKNWKNGHNDLVAFATNLHERFPLCAVGGVIALPEWAGSPNVLTQMHGICSRSIPRDRAVNAYGKFEGFALVIYNTERRLVWPHPLPDDSPLKPSAAFRALADKVYARTLAIV